MDIKLKFINKEAEIKPTAILTSDWHLRTSTPSCRDDDFVNTQIKKIEFITNLQKKYDIPIINAGDLFNYWKNNNELLTLCIKHLPLQFVIIGNHDMPFHNREYLKKSNLSVLEATGKIIILNKVKRVKVENSDILLNVVGCHWEDEIKEAPFKKVNEYNILVVHTMISLDKREKSKVFASIKALDLLDKCKGYDLVLSGHNHNSFVEKNDFSILINPGGITRTAINQIHHQPCLYLWYAKEMEVEKIMIPCESFGSILNEEYMISNFVEKNELYSFISNLKKTELITSFSFQDNLNEFMNANKVEKEVKEIVLASLN